MLAKTARIGTSLAGGIGRVSPDLDDASCPSAA
jgi:hypothetical protein